MQFLVCLFLKGYLLRKGKKGEQLFKTLKECCLSSIQRAGSMSAGELTAPKNSLRNSVSNTLFTQAVSQQVKAGVPFLAKTLSDSTNRLSVLLVHLNVTVWEKNTALLVSDLFGRPIWIPRFSLSVRTTVQWRSAVTTFRVLAKSILLSILESGTLDRSLLYINDQDMMSPEVRNTCPLPPPKEKKRKFKYFLIGKLSWNIFIQFSSHQWFQVLWVMLLILGKCLRKVRK